MYMYIFVCGYTFSASVLPIQSVVVIQLGPTSDLGLVMYIPGKKGSAIEIL